MRRFLCIMFLACVGTLFVSYYVQFMYVHYMLPLTSKTLKKQGNDGDYWTEPLHFKLHEMEIHKPVLVPPTAETIPGLFNFSILRPDEKQHRLLNLHLYSFTLTSDLCQGRSVFLLILVHTSVCHFKPRRMIRNTFGSVKNISNKNIVVIFLVGTNERGDCQQNVENEAAEFKDIVQGNFKDVYANLTLKHVMGQHWTLNHCPEVTFILKIDDDVFMNPYILVRHLLQLDPTNVLECSIIRNKHTARRNDSKYQMSYEMYPFTNVPDFCQGFGYIVSPDVVSQLYRASSVTRFIAMDDVYVTGIIRSNLGMTFNDFKNTRHDCPKKRILPVSVLNSTGIMLAYLDRSCLAAMFDKWPTIQAYFTGMRQMHANDFINLTSTS
ncbi:beta-1,3-galactosyltransferase 5-like [Haliotis rufescens]|uniref:beta-1,3-galactosyltransferase 5-like n=1 Tax=Haliotis rufescens TaxID=6454 RepID=UPI00201E8B18|nr:beta-1,3-galactosyltransferase 5-like [Haliotis rufescens]